MLTCATRPIKKLIGLHPWILASLLVCLVPGTVMAGQLYAVQHGSSQIHTIDLTTGEATLVNPVPLTDLAGIAFDALGTLYAITDSPNEAVLYTIDPDDGTAALVGLTATPAFEGGLTFDPSSGVLYGKGGVDGFDAGLIIFDSTTGLGGLVGSMGLAVEADISGMDFMADGTLLAYDPQGELNSRILSIDPLSGAASVIGNTGFFTTSTYGGLAVDPDTDLVYRERWHRTLPHQPSHWGWHDDRPAWHTGTSERSELSSQPGVHDWHRDRKRRHQSLGCRSRYR